VIGEPATELPENPTAGLLATAFLEVGGRELTGRDLLAAGVVSGHWQRVERDLAQGLALVAARRPIAVDVRHEVEEFRLARKLLSAEDMRAWLVARGLRMSAVNGVAERVVARRLGGHAEPAPAAEIEAALASEAICTGAISQLGWWLADRILSAASRELTVEPIPLKDMRIQRLVFDEATTVAGATIPESGSERGQRLAWISALDEAHRAWEEGVTGTEEVARVMREHELDWSRLELDELRLEFPSAAAEAARQLAEGRGADQVAAVSGASLIRRRVVLADAPPELARALAGAVAGDVVGPWRDGEDHVVGAVRDRARPEIGDAEVLARARAELLADAASRLRAGKVRWYDRA
jgi:hypothetical protein